MLTPQNKPNTPAYFLHYDILKSLINKHTNKCSDSMFVTVQPSKLIFTKVQAEEYLTELFPNELDAVIQLERNDKVSYGGKYKSYDLLPTLHIHLIISKKQLAHIPHELYNNNAELRKIKSNSHVAACPLFNTEGLVKYLVKQYHQNLQPFAFQISKSIYNENGMREKAPIDAFWLLQMIACGTTYSQLKQHKQNLNKNLIRLGFQKEIRLSHQNLLSLFKLISCPIARQLKFLQVKPNPPNATSFRI